MKTKKQSLAPFINAFPDLRLNIEDKIAEGDKVAVRVNITGTHKGEFQGISPTGKKVSFVGIDFLAITDGKITEEWVGIDTMGLMQQIVAIPTAPSDSGSKNPKLKPLLPSHSFWWPD